MIHMDRKNNLFYIEQDNQFGKNNREILLHDITWWNEYFENWWVLYRHIITSSILDKLTNNEELSIFFSSYFNINYSRFTKSINQFCFFYLIRILYDKNPLILTIIDLRQSYITAYSIVL